MSPYKAKVYVDPNDMVGLEHALFASDATQAKQAGWKWLDVIETGGRVVVMGPDGIVGTWVHHRGEDVWTGVAP